MRRLMALDRERGQSVGYYDFGGVGGLLENLALSQVPTEVGTAQVHAMLAVRSNYRFGVLAR